jgi:hypothetical protein
MVPSMALTTHMVTIDGVDPHGPGPSPAPALDYVQVVDLGDYLMPRRADRDGLTVHVVEAVSSTSCTVNPRADVSWTTPPKLWVAEPMGT